MVKFLEKGSTSSYPIIIIEVFESKFEGVSVDIELKVLCD